MLKIIAFVIGLIMMLSPETHVWGEKNVLYIERDGEIRAFKFEVIGESWNSENKAQKAELKSIQ